MSELSKEFFENMGYFHVRQLPTGEWAGILPLMYTRAICAGLNKDSWDSRWCYEDFDLANKALETWDGEGEPASGWVARRGRIRG